MYQVSERYLETIEQAVQNSRIIGTIGDVAFTENNILEGSFSITNQCCDGSNVQIGQVYVGQLNITLVGMDLTRYTVMHSAIIPHFSLKLNNGQWENVPLGIYDVDSAEWTETGIVITAYDRMSRFDKSCTLNSVSNTAYQLAVMACRECGLDLVNDASEFSTFANGSEVLTLYTEGSDIESWRDFVSWLAQTLGCNVTMTRNGKVRFFPYNKTVVKTLDTDQRFTGGKISDFITTITGMSVVNLTTQKTKYYTLNPSLDTGLTYNLGSNPFMQYGTEEYKEVMVKAILTSLKNVQYVPFEIEEICNPMYDLGDVISLPNGLGDADAFFCVNKIDWTFHKTVKLTGVGSNPSLASGKSKTDKNISGLLNQMTNDTMHYYDFENSSDITIRDGRTAKIIDIDYITSKDTHVDFHAELKATIDSTENYDPDADVYSEHDVTGEVTYYLNDEPVFYQPLETMVDGIHLRHLLYVWSASANILGNFRVDLTSRGGEIILPLGSVRGYMAGQGLVGEVVDTNPNVEDVFTGLVFDIFNSIIDSAEVALQTPSKGVGNDTLNRLTFSLFRTITEHGEVMQGVGFTPYMSTEYLSKVTVPVVSNRWVADEPFQYIETIDLYGITGFHSTTGGALSYQVSFDGGTTWGAWNGTTFTAGAEMTYTDISAVSTWNSPARFKVIFDNAESLGAFMVIGGRLNE